MLVKQGGTAKFKALALTVVINLQMFLQGLFCSLLKYLNKNKMSLSIIKEASSSISSLEDVFGPIEVTCNPIAVNQRFEHQLKEEHIKLVTVLCVPCNSGGWFCRLDDPNHKSTKQLASIGEAIRNIQKSGFAVDWTVILGDVSNFVGLCLDGRGIGEAVNLSTSFLTSHGNAPFGGADFLTREYEESLNKDVFNGNVSVVSALAKTTGLGPSIVQERFEMSNSLIRDLGCSNEWRLQVENLAWAKGAKIKSFPDSLQMLLSLSKDESNIWSEALFELIGSARVRALVSACFPADSILVSMQSPEVDDFFHLLDNGESFPTIRIFPKELLSSLDD